MTVSEFFSLTKGSRQLRFNQDEQPLCGRDFWGRYRNTPLWDAEIEHVRMVAQKAEQDGMWFDGVICNITVKAEPDMTLDEAIVHAREVVAEQCGKCAREHQQLAEWLELLKAYIETGLTPKEVSAVHYKLTYSPDAALADHYRNIGLTMDRLDELAAADKAGRAFILPPAEYTDADGEKALKDAMWKVGNTNNGATRFAADAIAEKLVREAEKEVSEP